MGSVTLLALLSGYNIKESRFTFPVGTNQSNMLAL